MCDTTRAQPSPKRRWAGAVCDTGLSQKVEETVLLLLRSSSAFVEATHFERLILPVQDMAACNSSSHEASDVLMLDPFLEYINGILMDDAGMDDAAFLQQANGPSDYQAIFSSLQAIVHGVLPPAAASACGKDAIVEYPQVLVAQEHGHGKPLKLLSAGEPASSYLASELELSFEDLNLGDIYTSLYVEELSSSTPADRCQYRRNGDKKKFASKKGSAVSEKQHASELGPDAFAVDVREALISCAQAVAIGDVRRVNAKLQEIHNVYGASANGTGLQRIAYIFSKALAARMSGTGVQEMQEAMSCKMPSSAEVLKASKVDFKLGPFKKIMHYFANQSILKVAEGASRLHILDYGLMHGLHWACLINALADRKGGPPLLVITGIEYPEPGIDMAGRLVESGRRLAAYAKTHNVPFQYHALVTDKWEDLDAASLRCSKAEVLVVNFVTRLRNVPDDGDDFSSTTSARHKLLTFVRSLHPHLLVTAVLNAAHNSPFFVSRFREALDFYSCVSDMLDTVWGNIAECVIRERAFFSRCITNIVACEGAERVERPETYRHWHARITKAGFEHLPIPSTMSARLKWHVKQHHHKDFLVDDDDQKGWLLMGWKGRVLIAMSAWQPCCHATLSQKPRQLIWGCPTA